MIINKETKLPYTRSDRPNSNWTDMDCYVVDETTEDGKALTEKVFQHAPYYEFVLEEKIFQSHIDMDPEDPRSFANSYRETVLVDIIPTERPKEAMPEPTVEEMLQNQITALELALVELYEGKISNGY